MNAFQLAGRLVLSPHEDKDTMQATGEWLATDSPREVQR